MSNAGTDASVFHGREPELSRRRFLGLGAAAGAGLLVPGCGTLTGPSDDPEGDGSGSINLLFMKGDGGRSGLGQMTAAFRKAYPDINVNTSFVAYEELHDKIVAAAESGTFDIVQIDVIWPAEFATKNLLVDLTKRFPQVWRDEMLTGAVQTAEYHGRLYGVPWILDTKYLYANTAHLAEVGVKAESLQSWDQVMRVARAIKRKGIVEFPFTWSWAESEALLCDYTQLLGAFGGKFLDEAGRPAFNTGGGVRALQFMRQTVVEKLTGPKSLTALDDGVMNDFLGGQATFGLNWTYMINSANIPAESKIVGKAAMLQTPVGVDGNRPGVNGNMALAITSGSRKRQAAWKYLEFVTNQRLQNSFAQNALPVWKSSYDDPTVQKTNPAMVAVAKKQLDGQILRPTLARYFVLSQVIQAEVAAALSGKKPVQKALDDAARVVSENL
jgi:multiple sugar transport system substrate-binding protein